MRIEIDKDDTMFIIIETPQDSAFLKLHFGINNFGDKITGELRLYFGYQNSGAIKFESKIKEEK